MVKIILADWAQYGVTCKMKQGYWHESGLYKLLSKMSQYKTNIPFDIIIVINDAKLIGEYDYLKSIFPMIKDIRYRKTNRGMDFGAYNHGYQLLKKEAGYVMLLNSTVRGPNKDHWLEKYINLMNKSTDIGLCGIALCTHSIHNKYPKFRPHIRGLCLFSTVKILNHVFHKNLPGVQATNKKSVISHGEIKFSTEILNKGYRIIDIKKNSYQLGDSKNRLSKLLPGVGKINSGRKQYIESQDIL
tara:strand:- start:2339 stop:3070 length:732 start_codon:yes stop_codon:yes gene_type:complete